MDKLKKRFRDAIIFVLGVIFTTCVTVLAETCSTTLSSGNITYGNTTAEAEVTSLLTQAGNLDTRVGNLESRFINNATSYFNGDDLHLGANNTTGSSHIQLYGTNGTLRGTLMYDAEDDKTYLVARAASGAWMSGTLDLRGSSVLINGNDATIKTGSWTPTFYRANVTSASGSYYRIGKIMYLYGTVVFSSSQTNQGNIYLLGIPESYTQSLMGMANCTSDDSVLLLTTTESNTIWVTSNGEKINATNAKISGKTLKIKMVVLLS